MGIKEINPSIYIQKLDMPEKPGHTTAYLHLRSEEHANILLNEKKLKIYDNHDIRFYKYDKEKEDSARQKSKSQFNQKVKINQDKDEFGNNVFGSNKYGIQE